MAEFVLGTGHPENLTDVVEQLERHIRRTEGVPREIRANTGTVELVAKRGGFDGKFDNYRLKLRVSEDCLTALKKVASDYPEACSIVSENGALEVVCPPEGRPYSDSSQEALDKLGKCIEIPEVWRASGAD